MHESEYEHKDTEQWDKLFKTHPSNYWKFLEEKIPDREKKAVIEHHESHKYQKTDSVFHGRKQIILVECENRFHSIFEFKNMRIPLFEGCPENSGRGGDLYPPFTTNRFRANS